MKLTRRETPAQSETIIALIDVVFFLLVFFMLIGRMDATAPFDVLPPVATTGSDMPAGGVTLSVSQAGDLAFDGQPITRTDVEAALTRALSREPQTRLRINAHKDAELRHILPLVSLAESVGIPNVVLVVTPPSASGR